MQTNKPEFKPKCICSNCVLFHPGFRWQKPEERLTSDWGECRLKPLPTTDDAPRPFAAVHKEDWCGSFNTKWWTCSNCNLLPEPSPSCPVCLGLGRHEKHFTDL